MRSGRPILLALGVLLAALPRASATPTEFRYRVVQSVLSRIPIMFGLPMDSPVPPALIPQGSDGDPTVSLTSLRDPLALERQLREIVKAPYPTLRLTVPNGQARLGDFSVGSAQTLEGHLLVVRGRADLYGTVRGNVVTLDGDILVHRGATVAGDALAIGGRVRNLGGRIEGEVRSVESQVAAQPVPAPSPWLTALSRGAGVLGVFITLTLLGFGIVLFGRSHLEIVSDTASHSFLRSFTVGLLSQILTVPVFGMLIAGLVLSVVGILLIPFVVVVYALLMIAGVLGGFIAVAHAMGEVQTRRRMALGVALSANSFRYLLVGLGAIAAIWLAWVAFSWVPIAGAVILAVAILATWVLGTVGLGACVLSRAGVRPHFAGRYVAPEMLTDEYLWATPKFGVPAVQRPAKGQTPRPKA